MREISRLAEELLASQEALCSIDGVPVALAALNPGSRMSVWWKYTYIHIYTNTYIHTYIHVYLHGSIAHTPRYYFELCIFSVHHCVEFYFNDSYKSLRRRSRSDHNVSQNCVETGIWARQRTAQVPFPMAAKVSLSTTPSIRILGSIHPPIPRVLRVLFRPVGGGGGSLSSRSVQLNTNHHLMPEDKKDWSFTPLPYTLFLACLTN
jgi:hypothetical protein